MVFGFGILLLFGIVHTALLIVYLFFLWYQLGRLYYDNAIVGAWNWVFFTG